MNTKYTANRLQQPPMSTKTPYRPQSAMEQEFVTSANDEDEAKEKQYTSQSALGLV